jgi:hypothetical protein
LLAVEMDPLAALILRATLAVRAVQELAALDGLAQGEGVSREALRESQK